MDDEARIDAVEGELAALVAAVAAGPPGERVPTCPDFSLDDLAGHVGQFCGFWAHVLCEATGRPKPPYSPEVAPGGRVGWLQALTQALVRELRATPPSTEAWTWHPTDHTARFVARRCSHEFAVHRVDAQLAAGGPEAVDPVAPALAADGIDEVFVLMAHAPGRTASRAGAGGGRRGQTLHLHGTDLSPAEWLVTFDPAGVSVERAHAKGDLALRGGVSDLEMLLYQRPTLGPVETFGDPAVLDLFHAEFTFV
jgi:uncharacterized protein (TIGR03083 family)